MSFLLRQQLLACLSSLQRRLLRFRNNHISTRFYFLKRGILDKSSLTIIITIFIDIIAAKWIRTLLKLAYFLSRDLSSTPGYLA